MSLLSDGFFSNGRTIACLSSPGIIAFTREAFVMHVTIGTIESMLFVSCLVGTGSSVHVVSVLARIDAISAVLVGSNTSRE